MEVSVQSHTSVNLPEVKESSVPTERERGWALYLVLTLWIRGKYPATRTRILFRPASTTPAVLYLPSDKKEESCVSTINHLTPNGHYMGRTAQLTSRCCILYIYSTNIRTEYFKHAA